MLNTIFTTFFEYQIGEPMWMLAAKAVNCAMLFFTVERIVDFAVRKWNNYQIRKQEEQMEKTMRPIGFR